MKGISPYEISNNLSLQSFIQPIDKLTIYIRAKHTEITNYELRIKIQTTDLPSGYKFRNSPNLHGLPVEALDKL